MAAHPLASLAVKSTWGGIQQLRGQEEGEGGSAKSPRLSTQGGGSLNVHVDQNLAISESISYYCALWTVMGGKKEIELH